MSGSGAQGHKHFFVDQILSGVNHLNVRNPSSGEELDGGKKGAGANGGNGMVADAFGGLHHYGQF